MPSQHRFIPDTVRQSIRNDTHTRQHPCRLPPLDWCNSPDHCHSQLSSAVELRIMGGIWWRIMGGKHTCKTFHYRQIMCSKTFRKPPPWNQNRSHTWSFHQGYKPHVPNTPRTSKWLFKNEEVTDSKPSLTSKFSPGQYCSHASP